MNAYYAREVLSQKVGLSNIQLEMDSKIDWSELTLGYTEYFQDNFFGIDKNLNLHVFLIDTNLYVKILRLKIINIGIKIHELDQLNDFKFVEDKLTIYTQSRMGWENQIVLNFFHFKSVINPVLTKRVVLD